MSARRLLALRGGARALGLLPGRPSLPEFEAAGQLGLIYGLGVPGGWRAIPSGVLDEAVDQLHHERGVGGALVAAVLDQAARRGLP